MSTTSLVLPPVSLDERVEGILRHGIPEVLTDARAAEHHVELLPLSRISKTAARETVDTAFRASLVPSYFADKQMAQFYVERSGSGPSYKSVAIVLPQDLWDHLDVLGTHILFQGNGSGKAVMQQFLANSEAAAWRSRVDRPVNGKLYGPLIEQLVKMGVPAEARPLKRKIGNHHYLFYGINLDARQDREAEYLAQNKPVNFQPSELTEYHKALHTAHYRVAWAEERSTHAMQNPEEINLALHRACLARRIGCNLLDFPQFPGIGKVIISYDGSGVATYSKRDPEEVVRTEFPYIAKRVTQRLPPALRNGGIKGYEIVKAA